MARGDTFSLMADEIIRDIRERGWSFRTAFMKAAHARGVFHHLDSRRYNNWYQITRQRVSERENRLLRKALQKNVTPQDILFFVEEERNLESWDPEDPLDPRNYEDNIGFIHLPILPYSHPAYEADD